MRTKLNTLDNISEDTVVIHHSRKGAFTFGVLVFGIGGAIIAVMMYLMNQAVYTSIPIPLIAIFFVIFLILLHVLKHLFIDAGNVAISLGREGIKFDRYDLIEWSDIEDVYTVEDSDGPDCLWLRVREGVEFLPKGPKPLLWLASKTGLDRCIDISGYGSLSLSDKEILVLIKQGLERFGKL